MTELAFTPEDDVRIACSDPRELIGRLFVSKVVTLSSLTDAYPELCRGYKSQNVLVPNPTTTRVCTEEETLGKLVVPFSEDTPLSDSRVIAFLPHTESIVELLQNSSQESFGRNDCAPGMLTTTPEHKSGLRVGLHFDNGEGWARRVGVNHGPGERALLVGARSGAVLLRQEGVKITTKEQVVQAKKTAITQGALCLHMVLKTGDAYMAWTRDVLHDGSTLLLSKESQNTPQRSEVDFFELPRH